MSLKIGARTLRELLRRRAPSKVAEGLAPDSRLDAEEVRGYSRGPLRSAAEKRVLERISAILGGPSFFEAAPVSIAAPAPRIAAGERAGFSSRIAPRIYDPSQPVEGQTWSSGKLSNTGAPVLSPDASKLFICGKEGVAAFDRVSGEELGLVALACAETTPAVSPDGRAVFASAGRKLVSIDAEGMVERWSASLPAVIGSPSLTRDGRTLLARSIVGGQLIALDASTGRSRWCAELEKGGEGTVVISPDDSTAVVTTRRSLTAVDVATGEVRWKAKLDNEWPNIGAFSADGSLVHWLGFMDVQSFDAATGTETLNAGTFGSVERNHVAPTPDGSKLVVVANGNAIRQFNAQTGRMERETKLWPKMRDKNRLRRAPVFSADSAQLLMLDDDHGFHRVDLKTGKAEEHHTGLALGWTYPSDFAVSPDGRFGYFHSGSSGGPVCAVEIDALTPRPK
jgi:outer membrane protein assembly factor BamB